MEKQFVAIVSDTATATAVCSLITRVLGLPVEVHSPGSIRRIVTTVSETNPDVILYTWDRNPLSVLRWLKEHKLDPGGVNFVIYSYKGFDVADAYAINRELAWTEDVRPIAYVA